MLAERVLAVAHVGTGIVLLMAGLAILALLSVNGRILRRMKANHYVLVTEDGPEIHSPLPQFEAVTTEGLRLGDPELAGREFVLLLVSPTCGPCEGVLNAAWQVGRDRLEGPVFVVVIDGPADATRRYARGRRGQGLLFAEDGSAIAQRLDVRRVPYAILVDEQGIVRMKGVVNHRDHLEALMARRGKAIGSLVWDVQAEPGPHSRDPAGTSGRSDNVDAAAGPVRLDASLSGMEAL